MDDLWIAFITAVITLAIGFTICFGVLYGIRDGEYRSRMERDARIACTKTTDVNTCLVDLRLR